MSEFAVGDKVRVVYEGEVTAINGDGEPHVAGQYHYVEGSEPMSSRFTPAKVEIVEKRKPKVGDVIESESRIPYLPDGSVIHSSRRTVPVVKVFGRWHVSGCGEPTSPSCLSYPTKIVYIP